MNAPILPAPRPVAPRLAALGLALLLAACGGAAPEAPTGTTPPVTSPAPTPGDTTAPTVSLSAAQSGTAVTLSAAASDDVGVSRVAFYRGTTLISTDTDAPYSAGLTVGSADNGAVSFTARAYDAAGNAGAGSAALNVYVAPPATPAPTPTPGKTLHQGVWSWSAADSAGRVVGEGTLTLDGEVDLGTGKLATGTYRTAAGTQSGYAGLGPLLAAGHLDVALSYSADPASSLIYLTASDSDGQLETQNGQAVFSGAGVILDRATQQPQQPVAVTLRQLSAELPGGQAGAGAAPRVFAPLRR
ncbi:Ig-like domain-containing protein [Deinococcus petrolearius]|uniref:Ig-like domain-containing protein n=1 Tax=Deinococcus petrolearius TaxID=1751295 RepID=A0ABW1DHY0_9DEIO